MTINDQIRDEKQQYNINREAAKISCLSSSKIHKYEYVTGEDILRSNQQQIILGKTFEKQIKAIEDQGEKQVEALKLLEPKEHLVNVKDDDYEDKLLHSKKRKIFLKKFNKRLDKIEELTRKIDGNNFIFTTLSTGETVDFSKKNDPLTFN